jgi:hypothetical protein
MAERGKGFEGVLKIVDHVQELLEKVNDLTTADVLVGIPKANNSRKDSPIGNAQLARIHEHGSPAQNIPARPFMGPGVKEAHKEFVKIMREGASAMIKGEKVNVEAMMTKVGILARNAVVRAITDPEEPFAPLKPATIRARLRRTAAGRRKIKQIRAKGISLEAWASQISADGTMNIRPLLDTLQMRSSITYVVRRNAEKEGGE